MIKKIVKILKKFPRIVGIIFYPIILLIIGFMIGAGDRIILMYGKDDFYLHLLISLIILLNTIILKNLPEDKNEN